MMRFFKLLPLLLSAFPLGCGPNNSVQNSASKTKGAVDPWPRLAVSLRNADALPKNCRQALVELNSGLGSNSTATQPRVATPMELSIWADLLNLTAEEAKFLAPAEFTPLDGNYLAECLFLQEAISSWNLPSTATADQKAKYAFDWVCRQIVLNPWVQRTPQGLVPRPPVPPIYALSKGSGGGLDRAYAFLALCRQLDLDAYLVGGPMAVKQPWSERGSAKENTYPKGPFWAVGVRIENSIQLFEPWRGEAIPGTFAELRAKPDSLAWLAPNPNTWDVTANDLKSAELYVAAPLSAYSPRMRSLHDKLKAELGVRLAVEPLVSLGLGDDARGGATVKIWNPPGELFGPVRGLGSFLPSAQGGFDAGPPNETLFEMFRGSLIPVETALRVPAEIQASDASIRFRAMAFNSYTQAFFPTTTPREKLLLGRTNEATKDLVAARDRFQLELERTQTALSGPAVAEAAAWVEDLNLAYTQLSRAKADKGGDVGAAQQRIEQHWKNGNTPIGIIVGSMVSNAGLAEASYLLAQGGHEQAEALEAAAERAERAAARDLSKSDAAKTARAAATIQWVSARNAWVRYSEYAASQNISFPGRQAHAAALQDRAAKRAEVK